jgi:hypothetical protein
MEIHQPLIGMPLRGKFPDLLVTWPFIQLKYPLEIVFGAYIIARKDVYSPEAAPKYIFRRPPNNTSER